MTYKSLFLVCIESIKNILQKSEFLNQIYLWNIEYFLVLKIKFVVLFTGKNLENVYMKII